MEIWVCGDRFDSLPHTKILNPKNSVLGLKYFTPTPIFQIWCGDRCAGLSAHLYFHPLAFLLLANIYLIKKNRSVLF